MPVSGAGKPAHVVPKPGTRTSPCQQLDGARDAVSADIAFALTGQQVDMAGPDLGDMRTC
jgi:hypothetical protein